MTTQISTKAAEHVAWIAEHDPFACGIDLERGAYDIPDECAACGVMTVTIYNVDHRPFVCSCSAETRPTMDDPCRESINSLLCSDCHDLLRESGTDMVHRDH